MSLSTEIGTRIRFYRSQNEISQEKLAEMCNLHATYIGQLERGEKSPSVEVLFRISQALNISLSALLEDIDDIVNAKSNNIPVKIYKRCIQLPPKKQKALLKLLEDMIRLL